MIIYNIKNELNKMLLSVPADTVNYDDYRYKMINDNKIEGILPLEMRNINGESRLYYDISGRENFVRYVSVRNLTVDELLKLTGCMMRASEKMREYLLEESHLVFEPDLIFRNSKTGDYEFICIPGHIRDEAEIREDMLSLLQLIISHIDPENTDVVEIAYAIYEMGAAGPVLSKTLYETVWEMSERSNSSSEIAEEEEDMPEDFYERVEKGVYKYRPSLREFLGVGFAASGIICLGLSAYWAMIYK